MKTKKQFGLWKSDISAKDVSLLKRLNDVQFSGDTIVWIESREGSYVIVAQKKDDAPNDISTGVEVGGGVGYGGGEFGLFENKVAFSGRDGRIYIVDIEYGKPMPLTPEFGSVASPVFSPDGKHLAYVHTENDIDVIAVVPVDGLQWPKIIAKGADFYSNPTWSPDGKALVYLCWDHPHMPWDFSRIEKTSLEGEKEIIFNENAAQQPLFSPDGNKLAFLSDAEAASEDPEAGGRWQIFVKEQSGEIRQITNSMIDFGGPAWVQGIRYIDWINDEELIALGTHQGKWAAYLVNSVTCNVSEIDALKEYGSLSQPSVGNSSIAFLASSPHSPPRVITLDKSLKSSLVIQRATSERLPKENYAPMVAKAWERAGEQVFGNFYPPTNPKYESEGLPPAIVMIHGGPTSQRAAEFSVINQFFATRGFAVMDVNYRGSTGYGRKYMHALYGQWGVADVEDAVSAAKYLASAKLADPNKIVIMGGSAGGYTVLQALVDHPSAFAAGVCMYGISNLFTLAMSTHKFEKSYNDLLLGALPGAADIFKARSPLFSAEKMTAPLAIFHGKLDRAVPFDQAESLVSKLTNPHSFFIYEDEGHGWRKPKNIEHFYKHTLEFLEQHILFS